MSHDDTPTPQVVEIKVLESVEIKDAEKGEIEAVFATLDVVDNDHDIIRPAAIVEGAKAKLSDYAHSAVFGAAPVGKGTMHRVGNKAVFRGRYFMSTTRGVEAFNTLKEIGSDQEWSFGYQVLGSEEPEQGDREKGAWRILTKLDSFEVSPVLRGAGIGTRTVSVKAAGGQPPSADAATEAKEVTEPAPPAAESVTAPAADDPAAQEAARKAAADEAETKRVQDGEAKRLQEEIDAGVERFQRTRRQFNL
jgi:Caudovirus prohead serine protease